MFLPSNITLKPGDSGDFVAELQRRLAGRDFLTSDMVTSFYDGATTNAVRQFQTAHGIRADGVAGPETLRRLNGFSDSTSGSGGNQDSTEQASARAPASERLMLLQMEEERLLEQQQLQNEMQQQAALQQQQHIDPQQHENAQLHTETKKQLPGVEAGRDQHVAREQRIDVNQQTIQQAFIDRPISQTFAQPQQEHKPEQEVGTHNRGPNLGLNPERAAEHAQERSPEQQQLLQQGLSRPREEGLTREAGREQGREAQPGQNRTPETALGQSTAHSLTPGQSQERAPLRIHSPSQNAAPEFTRIRDQMESRLPPHIIQEVKQVGVVMLDNGVQGGQSTPAVSAPTQTPGMDMRQQAVGGGRGA